MSKKALFSKYLKELSAVALQGDAREESFYPALADMLAEVAQTSGRTHVRVTTLPKPTDAGNPDFRLWNGTDRIVGYVEAKKPTEERLDLIEDSEQLRRYRSTFPNLILTNFLEFRLYRNGERVETVLAARPLVLNRLRTIPPIEKPDELFNLLDRFLGFSLPKAFTAECLAVELAKRTRFLRDVVSQQLQQEQETPGMLSGFFEAFQAYLIGTLTPEDFADLFAQTIAYGLFAARTRAGDGFSRRAAFDNIPHTIGVLRDLFRFISLGDLPEQLAWCVDDLAEVLAVADAPGILDRYYHEGKGSDPIVHFYETFLAQYDPAERERRGVYYTPEPVVSYIVRSLHGLLKTEFKKPDGLASDGVRLLDPAAGTMTFVARAAREAVAEFEAKYGAGAREDFIRRHILKNFYAFELMMAPYAVGHLKMGFFLEELGHRLADNERVPFYLTNTLDIEELEQSKLPGFSALAEESRLAGKVKKQTPILVILGNPPYSGHSSNIGEWIRGLVEDYKQVDDKPLGEKTSKWLQDDYVKFLRFAQWKIEQAGCGVVGMITNHGYLDNPTFRGMRQSLMRTFDDIYVLDLHGNSLKRETCPDGSKDENVFDIRQGVAIAFFINRGGKETRGTVRHADLWGAREAKYAWLDAYDLKHTDWRDVKPASPFHLFVPRDEAGSQRYQEFMRVAEVFPLNGVGMTTARDEFVIGTQKSSLINRVCLFKHNKGSDDELHRYFSIRRKKGWSIRRAWKMLQELTDTQLTEHFVPVLYRPFDVRWIFYHDSVVWRTVKRVMRHMLAGENVALLVSRQVLSDFRHAFVSETVTNFNNIDIAGRFGSGYQFPLYLYPTADQQDLFAHHDSSERRPNLNPKVVTALAAAYGAEPTPEQIFHYVYAVLYAPSYREKYAEFLRMDFPRIPFTTGREAFQSLARLGERLAGLHLLKSPELDPPACRFEGVGDSRIVKGRKAGLRYEPGEQRVYPNTTQYFAPVPEAVWTYQVGGYQVCEKWLKDRQERRLEVDDIRTYCRIVTALGLTISIQQEINALYPQAESKTVALSEHAQASESERPTRRSSGRGKPRR
jgi:hypothetical protein